ncbi:MAG: cupin domain-containing protein [Myxococcales bacterium FL481]|nr:MAG: cupin domain-containing protein [Myxococcales bacterium FL481]
MRAGIRVKRLLAEEAALTTSQRGYSNLSPTQVRRHGRAPRALELPAIVVETNHHGGAEPRRVRLERSPRMQIDVVVLSAKSPILGPHAGLPVVEIGPRHAAREHGPAKRAIEPSLSSIRSASHTRAMSDPRSSPTTRKPTDHRVRTALVDWAQAAHLRHPLNDRSEIRIARLSDPAGLRHIGVSIARIPPGKESFALHVHELHEEWIYVIEGTGRVRLDDHDVEVQPGDFVGFPANGPAHLVRNDGDVDLVYLQGGDRREGDRARFPALGMVAWQHDDGHMAWVPDGQVELKPFTDWLARE